MFLVKGDIHSEPIWRQFLENAGKLSLKTKTFKIPNINLKKKLKNGLHQPINGLEESRYPGYKIQHGLVPPSKHRSTSYPHVRKRLLAFNSLSGLELPAMRDDPDDSRSVMSRSIPRRSTRFQD